MFATLGNEGLQWWKREKAVNLKQLGLVIKQSKE